ncbi:hypothetical protein MIR68_012007 [Amoeboaphelidium protococcarum]|nr:hypothetical protein MIR68_012007 [Amoeboaphelidium protococcarum]
MVTESQKVKNKGAIQHVAQATGISKKLISKWLLASDEIMDPKFHGSSRKLHSGPQTQYKIEEESMVAWVHSQRELRKVVTNQLMAAYVMKEFPNTFQAYEQCLAWTYRVLDRNNLSIRRKTHDQTKLSEEEMGRLHRDFVVYVRYLMDEFSVEDDDAINMDETGVHFDMTSSTTVEIKGTQHVSVVSSSNSGHCTVFLAVSLAGTKLKPLIVFKAKPGATVHKQILAGRNDYDARVICTVQENAYCDEFVMGVWLDKCLNPHLNRNNEKKLSLLMMDNFSPHQCASVRDQLSESFCLLVMLPPNMTSKVQILDVGVNKPFKDHIRAQFLTFMSDFLENQQKVTREMMSTWVANAWEKITVTTFIKTSKKIGFLDE